MPQHASAPERPAVPLGPKPQTEQAYWSFIKSTQERSYPEFVRHLSAQAENDAEKGRMAVVEFRDGSSPTVRRHISPETLRYFLDGDITNVGSTVQRVFLLEGLPRRFIEILGSRLRVPPGFFAANWVNSEYVGSLLNRTPRNYDCRDRFVLKMPRLHQVKIRRENGDKPEPFYYMDTSIRRRISSKTVFGDFDGPLSSSERVSFWRTSQGESWDGRLCTRPSETLK